MNKATIADSQLLLFELLVYIDSLCNELNISYWIDGGTLLGAIRNNEFIAWDDDLDICLMYKDYLILNDALATRSAKSEHYIFYNNHRTNSFWVSNFGDLRILQDGLFPVKIDIIGIKSIENTPNAISVDSQIVNEGRTYLYGKPKNSKVIIPSELVNIEEKTRFMSRFHSYNLQNSTADNGNLFSYIFNDMIVNKDRQYYRYEDIYPLKKIALRGRMFSCPNNSDSYLTLLYGRNYITPPAKDLQIPHFKMQIFSGLDKNIVAKFISIYYKRESTLFLARHKTNKLARYYKKLFTFIPTFFSIVKLGNWTIIQNYISYIINSVKN